MTTKDITNIASKTYYSRFPSEIRTSLESGAYRSLCQHLRERSDEIQNIDMMSVSGFCRNCLAKWLVMEARQLSAIFKQQGNSSGDWSNNTSPTDHQAIISYLDTYRYDDAAQEVYGCEYSVWKKRHGKKASDAQLISFGESAPIHAKHGEDTVVTQQSFTKNKKSRRSSLNKANIQSMLEAGAFRNIVIHLRDRSDEVQNIDLMTVAGFCRNCLAKWLVLEARRISNTDSQGLLDAFCYDQAAEEVYGCSYPDWKKAHATKATNRQMVNYTASENIHAKHDMKMLLSKIKSKKRPDKGIKSSRGILNRDAFISKQDDIIVKKSPPPPLQSNVCCQDMEPTANMETNTTSGMGTCNTQQDNRSVHQKDATSSFKPPPPPEGPLSLTVGILTVSDRAASNEYTKGDLSGPKLEESILSLIEMMNQNRISDKDKDSFSPSLLSCQIVSKAIVPDETKRIQNLILTWSGKIGDKEGAGTRAKNESPLCDVIFTTGGTGFSPRDVTPEATLSILDRECRGLMSFCSAECSVSQPLAALSRGCAGICGQSIVVNLPGNPNAIGQIIDILFPLLLHAVKDLKCE